MAPNWKEIFRGRPRPRTDPAPEAGSGRIPNHVAIIMDGNGRWARSRGLPRAVGHRAGMASVRATIRAADDLGIGVLTLYAFSTENWKRPPQEVDVLMRLPQEFFRTDIAELVERNVRVSFIGDTDALPQFTQETVRRTMERTDQNTGMLVQFALNYGSRREIVDAARRIAERVLAGAVRPDEIDEALFGDELSTRGVPDPDLLIRTSGDQRISNFLLWQIAYTELYFVEEPWPDFRAEHLRAAVAAYGERERRYGGLK